MKVVPLGNSCAYGQPGVFRGHIKFDNPRLIGFEWPFCEIRGKSAGPRLCVSAGVHVNEVAAIEAAVRLQRLFDPETMRGSVSIIPVINQPAFYKYTQLVCPIDNRNINFTYPGSPEGSFSEALCDAVMNEWCVDANCYVDMHGGDLRERVSKFSIFQATENLELNNLGRKMALCFDAEFVVALPASDMEKPGRPPTAFARHNRLALMSEAGANGLLDEGSISFHVEGVLNVARTLGILDSNFTPALNARVVCDEYLWIDCPFDGEFHADVEPGDHLTNRQRIGTISNLFGEVLAEIKAPREGYLLWRMTHPTIAAGTPVGAVAVPEK
ncbi:succinylglutamate desuccinylase [Sinorhizobium meliloti]|uniref:succinylglutamate desuccinylase/aspartoacylase domain-containing protein n=1 Tax=Rhizobium meliloti TaxID=382 RepID=UPI000FD7B09F|nr:succinylglutamate desuccinylase/aspartoacylase family protein [Sinorhizobium meliloti]MDW9924838.1 succinylglutamate desuccinylase [Sinorhizobium meliloti]MDX0036140.1 succinylglutamate desuccinylase [Sinorhizobium meliloti]RVK27932.1 succinylglutamate desuccinylase [Sinorhizobium meliloti]